MTDAQLREIYKTACYGKNYEPTDGQFKVWKQTMGWAEERDLSQALVWYFEKETAFPMPAELKPLIERSRRERLQLSDEPKEIVEYACPSCGSPFSTVVNVGDMRPRLCLVAGNDNQLRGCRTRLTELSRMHVSKGQKRA